MHKQVLSVIVADRIGMICHCRISLQGDNIGVVHIEIHNRCFGLEKFRCESGVQACVNPTLAHVDVKFLIGDCFGCRFLQRFQRCFRILLFYAVKFLHQRHDFLVLGYDITCNEFPFMLPLSRYGVVENLALEVAYSFRLAPVRAFGYKRHIHPAVKIEACRQRFHRGKYGQCVYLLERHRLAHDVCLADFISRLHFDGEHLDAEAVKHDKLPVVVVMEISPLGNKPVIMGVKSLP